LNTDIVLAEYDVLGSIAHARMLGKCGIIPLKDSKAIIAGLNSVLKDLKHGTLKVDVKAEDVHTLVQNVLEKKIGKPAKKLHTARSRNDQVSLDTRMYCRDFIKKVSALIADLDKSLDAFAKKNKDIKVPGYTHMQHAQPVRLKDYIGAYQEMLRRDDQRFREIYKRVDLLPLGSCALAGTSLGIDRKYVARQLGFSGLCTNTLDAVSDRDFVIEILSAVALLGMHLSRLAEDLIIWTTSEFDFIQISEGFCTGSSMMPQKKNPDVLELIRGNTGRLYGNLVSLLVTMKGLPLTYNRDMQLDKPVLFDSLNIISAQLDVLSKLVRNIKVNKAAIDRQLKDPGLYATLAAEDLVKKGVAFQEAHRVVGQMLKKARRLEK
jgi:argininosuccinate lyase